MNKKTKFIVISLILIAVAVIAGLIFNKTSRFDVKNTTIEFVSNSEEEEQTALKIIEGQGVLVTTGGGSESERGLTVDQQEKIMDLLSRVTVVGEELAKEDACKEDGSPVRSWVTIRDADLSATKYFCAGIGVDEEGNLKGPIQDMLRAIKQIETAEE
jgi:hypothetical protein